MKRLIFLYVLNRFDINFKNNLKKYIILIHFNIKNNNKYIFKQTQTITNRKTNSKIAREKKKQSITCFS